jgi:hypothetical protein
MGPCDADVEVDSEELADDDRFESSVADDDRFESSVADDEELCKHIKYDVRRFCPQRVGAEISPPRAKTGDFTPEVKL